MKELKNMWISKNTTPSVYISAKNKENIEELREKLYAIVKEIHAARFPYNDFLYTEIKDLAEESTSERQLLLLDYRKFSHSTPSGKLNRIQSYDKMRINRKNIINLL